MAASRRKSDHVYTYGLVIILVVIMFVRIPPRY